MSKVTHEVAVFIVGGLLLEQAPKAVIMPDEQLETYFEPALQNFKDFMLHERGLVFDPDPVEKFKVAVMDHVRGYLDMHRMRRGL